MQFSPRFEPCDVFDYFEKFLKNCSNDLSSCINVVGMMLISLDFKFNAKLIMFNFVLLIFD